MVTSMKVLVLRVQKRGCSNDRVSFPHSIAKICDRRLLASVFGDLQFNHSALPRIGWPHPAAVAALALGYRPERAQRRGGLASISNLAPPWCALPPCLLTNQLAPHPTRSG